MRRKGHYHKLRRAALVEHSYVRVVSKPQEKIQLTAARAEGEPSANY